MDSKYDFSAFIANVKIFIFYNAEIRMKTFKVSFKTEMLERL